MLAPPKRNGFPSSVRPAPERVTNPPVPAPPADALNVARTRMATTTIPSRIAAILPRLRGRARNATAPKPRLRPAPGGRIAVRDGFAVDEHRLPAARARADPLPGEGGHRR